MDSVIITIKEVTSVSVKAPSPNHIFAILRSLDWHGHIELGDSDLIWLGQELAVALNPEGDSDLCEVCEQIKPIVLKTTLGRICEDCLDNLSEDATDIREQMEDE